jgi:glycosyltransferase involved in cell wall biosynthesis
MVNVMVRKLNSLDILTSALNENESLPILYKRICLILDAKPELDWKLYIVDNGSTDRTWESIKALSCSDKRVVGYRMSRTFPFDSAITATLDKANSDAVVIMCSDLQDPPELIPEMIARYEEGFDQVCVRIKSRKDLPFSMRILTKYFYRLARILSRGNLPENVSDFRLASRSCYEAARGLRENKRFIRGQFAWVGFRTCFLELDRPSRLAGKSKFLELPKWNVFWIALSAIFSHTAVPLTFIAATGLVLGIMSFGLAGIFAIIWLFVGVPFAGYGTIVGTILFGFSLVLFCLGIIALYIASIYEEVKHRPLYLIAEKTQDN